MENINYELIDKETGLPFNHSLKVIGEQEVAGRKFTAIEGGFGESKKSMLVKNISEIHEKAVKHVNELINKNRIRFKNGVDIIDLKVVDLVDLNFEAMGFSKMQISKANNIYLLSERGYSKLLKIMDDDLAWELYDQFVDEYFNMRAEIKKEEPKSTNSTMILLETAMKHEKQVSELTNEVSELKSEMVEIKKRIATNDHPQTITHQYLPMVDEPVKLYSTTEIAEELGVSSAKALNNILHEKGVQYNKKKCWYLYKKHRGKGYIVREGGHPYWTLKGKEFVHEMMRLN